MMDGKHGWKQRLASSLTAGLAVAVLFISGCSSKAEVKSVEARAREMHARILTIDTHCDTALRLLRGDWKIGERHDPSLRTSGQIDLPRMAEGGLDAEIFAAFTAQGPLTPEGRENAKRQAFLVLDAVHGMTAEYPNLVGLALTPEDAFRLKKEGKRAAFTGLENGYPIGLDLSLVRTFYDRGVRAITLCHTSDNDICDSSSDREHPEDNGISAFGRDVVRECNRLGILVDVSHASDESFRGILETSAAPVFASHSCARAICDHPRNLSDDMLKALAAKGGVVQICFLSSYVKTPAPNPERDAALAAFRERYGNLRDIKDEAAREKARAEYEDLGRRFPEEKASVKDLVDHIDHVVQVAGVDSVGIGTDFDGGGGLIDCNDASGMIHVTEELIRRGYSEEDIAKIWGGNFIRVFREAIAISQAAPETVGQ